MMVQNKDGKWGFIDESGKVMGSVKWDEINNFSDGMAMVRLYDRSKGSLWGFIDEQGNQIGDVCWSQVNSFSNGLAAV